MNGANWREIVCAAIREKIGVHAGCILLVDQDGLISLEAREQLDQTGWPVVSIDRDPLSLRLAYEQGCRGAGPALMANRLLLLPQGASVPFDIESELPQLTFGLTDLFPRLHPNLLADLPGEWYQALYSAQQGLPIGEGPDWLKTLAFVTRHGLQVELPEQPSLRGFLVFLAQAAISARHIPPAFNRSLGIFFRAVLGKDREFPDLSNAERFLRNIWQGYQKNLVTDPSLAEPADSLLAGAVSCLAQETAVQSAFTHLRQKGVLPAWEVVSTEPLAPWLQPNVHYFLDVNSLLAEELAQIGADTPNVDHSLDAWSRFAWRWARLRLRFYRTPSIDRSAIAQFHTVQTEIEDRFLMWLRRHYSTLLQRPYLPEPAMVHHLLPYLASMFREGKVASIAILVIDGASLEDWLALHEVWQQGNLTWRVENRTLLALLPTVTSVSRQALLSGKLPTDFADSWTNTHREGTLWKSFWSSNGIGSERVLYQRTLDAEDIAESNELEHQLLTVRPTVGAFVMGHLDSMVHQTHDASQLLARFCAWEERYRGVQRTISILLDHFDRVIVTSDHGHVEGRGVGDLPLGQVAEERALRLRLYTRQQAEELVDHPEAYRWPGWGLPEDSLVLLPRRTGLFAPPDRPGIGHGGASIEELFVPFVTFSRKE